MECASLARHSVQTSSKMHFGQRTRWQSVHFFFTLVPLPYARYVQSLQILPGRPLGDGAAGRPAADEPAGLLCSVLASEEGLDEDVPLAYRAMSTSGRGEGVSLLLGGSCTGGCPWLAHGIMGNCSPVVLNIGVPNGTTGSGSDMVDNILPDARPDACVSSWMGPVP